ncbi:MAG: ATP-binding cassette domain-containing protein [Ruminococcus sp.]|nr:ATP-binding cassette domain-containing protein [Ruminococcus sp.]
MIIGDNGSGKSTLVRLLSGLYRDYEGEIFINDKELKRYSLSSLRSKIAYAEQNPFIFSGKVFENIRLANEKATDSEIEALMESLDILSLKDRSVTMKTTDLSGGERQKISIARALIKDSPIIILDELINNIDSKGLNWLENFFKND